MSSFVLRMYNIPVDKSEDDLSLELTKIPVQFDKLTLARKSDGSSAGYALLAFPTQESLNEFAMNFQKLRSNLVIYHQL